MRLLEANVRGFGKLVERQFRFAPRAQLVVGDNEAGKSTLQQFILAMLFGLKREDRNRRQYLPQYELYRPWSNAPYGGRLLYELGNGQRIEVLRVFDRKEEALTVVDAVSGRDLTADFPPDARRERPFLQVQLQLTRQLFESTTALGQLAGRPSSAGVGALRERVQGLLDSGDERVSARQAIQHLETLRERLGSERTPTRGIGLLLRQRRVLQGELEAAQARHTEILDLHARNAQVGEAHAGAEVAWRSLRAGEVERERQELARRVARCETLERELGALRARLELDADLAEVNAAEYAPARARAATIAELAGQIESHAAAAEPLRRRVEVLRAFETRLGVALGGLDRSRFESLQQQAERLRERIGRVREARARHAEEQRRNRTVVDTLRRHHGRDWTRDEFLAELAGVMALRADRGAEALERTAAESGSVYRRAKQRYLVAAAVAFAAVVGIGALLGSRPALGWGVKLGVPAGLLFLALVGLARVLTRLVRLRDRARALETQAARGRARGQESRTWLAEVLRRNEVDSVEALQQARREYESLRAEAERSAAATSSGLELRELEADLVSLASGLQTAVGSCDVGALRTLQQDPPAPVRALLPYAEESAAEVEAGDPTDLRRLIEDLALLPQLRRAVDWLERMREQITALQAQIEREAEQQSARTARLEGEQAGLEAILHRNGARDLDDFAARVDRRRERDALLAAYEPLRREQDAVLGHETLAGLQARAAALEAESGSAGALPAAAAVAVAGARRASLAELKREVETLAAERAQLQERLAARESAGRGPAEVELEMQELDARIEVERKREAAVQLAAETLEMLAVSRHREVVPYMNQRVGEIFSRLSRGMHAEVRLDEDLTPRIGKDGGGVIGADSLSGGATDQLYFALRVTAGELLARSGERLPLLLDDPFVQYDPERLSAAFDLVTELAGEHQILFFTCEENQARALSERLRARDLEPDLLHL
jgi:hypothetical protein